MIAPVRPTSLAHGGGLPALRGVHAVTDMTGLGLLGHALETVRGSGQRLDLAALPLLDGGADLAAAGIRTGASTRNWASHGAKARLGETLPAWGRDLLCHPQDQRRPVRRGVARRTRRRDGQGGGARLRPRRRRRHLHERHRLGP